LGEIAHGPNHPSEYHGIFDGKNCLNNISAGFWLTRMRVPHIEMGLISGKPGENRDISGSPPGMP